MAECDLSRNLLQGFPPMAPKISIPAVFPRKPTQQQFVYCRAVYFQLNQLYIAIFQGMLFIDKIHLKNK